MKNNKYILILNNGSSSIKFAVFTLSPSGIAKEKLAGLIISYRQDTILSWQENNKKQKINYHTNYNLKNNWEYIFDLVKNYDISQVGVRIVHGGEKFINTTRVDREFLQQIAQYNDLAPLHNPVAITLIKLVKKTWPHVKIAASFDTAWYGDLKPAAYLYSLPYKYYQQYGIRKFGFHGLSHEAATDYAAKLLNKKLNKLKIISCHLGSGNSLTWYVDGKVIDTTMGFSPNEGLTMATRSGDIPADIILYLASKFKVKLKKLQNILSQQSGLYGLCGLSDLRDVLVAAGWRVPGYKTKSKFSVQQRKQAKLALEIYLYDIRRYLASYIGMSKKLDAIIFTGKVGVKSATIRRLSLKGLNLPSNCRIIIAPEGEMTNLANKTKQCLKKK